MKIATIRTAPLRLPYRDPMKTASNYFAEATGLLVEIATDGGLKGYGYADLFPRVGETIDTAETLIRQTLAPGLLGGDPTDLHSILDWMQNRSRTTDGPKRA